MIIADKRKTYFLALIIAVLTVLVYSPALFNGFVNWDDNDYVYQNSNLSSFSLQWMITTFRCSNWHPLTWFSLASDYILWGTNPFGYHLTNIILHGLNTFFVVIIINMFAIISNGPAHPRNSSRAKFGYLAGAVSGILFGLHPLHVESVAWISERKDVLYSFFFLLSILFYLKHSSDSMQKNHSFSVVRRYQWYALSLLLFTASIMSKPMAITLPFLLILFDIYPIHRVRLNDIFTSGRGIMLDKLPFIALSIISAVLTIRAQDWSIVSLSEMGLDERLLLFFHSISFYLTKFIFPFNLVVFYPISYPISSARPEYFIPLLLFFIVTGICVLSWKKQKLWLVVWSYYVISLLPVSGIVQVAGQSVADRYAYLPIIGPIFLVALGMTFVWNRLRSYILVAVAFIIIAYSALTVKQLASWKDSFALWNAELRQFSTPVGHIYRGIAYMDNNHIQQAFSDMNKAIDIAPSFYLGYYARGKLHLLIGDHVNAIADLEKTIMLNPRYPDAHVERIMAYKLALKNYNSAINKSPQDAILYMNRGSTYAMFGDINNAIDDFSRALDLDKGLVSAYFNRGLAYKQIGNFEKYTHDFKTAARLGDREAQNILNSQNIPWQEGLLPPL